MVVLAVGAHPDDIEFGCFGTLLKLSKEHKIYFLIFSKGELSAPPNIRTKEAERSANILGAEIEILDYPDGNIKHNSKTVKMFFDYVHKIKPDILFTLFPNDTHQDHINVSKICLSASRLINRILFYEVPQSINLEPNYFVNITNEFKHKSEALSYYVSQEKKPYLDIEQIRGMAQYRAYKIFRPGNLYESFSIFKWVEE